MTLGMGLILCLVGTPLSIGIMVLITYLENREIKPDTRAIEYRWYR